MNINYDKYSEVHKQLYHSCGLSFYKALRAPYCCPECFLLKVSPWFIFMSWIIFMYFHNCNPITLISKEDGEQKKNKLSTGFYRLHLICKTPTFMILVLSDTLYMFLLWYASLLLDTLPARQINTVTVYDYWEHCDWTTHSLCYFISLYQQQQGHWIVRSALSVVWAIPMNCHNLKHGIIFTYK